MLLNGKSEDLSKYSKVKYAAQLFVDKAKEVWEYSDLQIRCIYLISDLAKKGNGVFSIAHSTFKNMFEQRFDMKISPSTVRRFFGLMEKLGLLSINEAKRKNNSQSANIYIVEQQSNDQKDEHPQEHPPEPLNTSFQEVNDKQKPLINTVNTVKQEVDQDQIIYDTYIEFKEQGIDKSLFTKVLSQVKKNKEIRNFGKYLTGALKKVVGYKEVHVLVDFHDEEPSPKVDTNKIPYYYDWIGS
ncbi:hypothetical protein ABEY41_19195 [Peribacillus butanolivorans]|uniref:hypothetical protein n=1 Tax=Peribacillus butanolivorans TaxID=421767 RepID=UPI003D28FDC4